MRTALIDADTLVYEAALSSESPVEWTNDLWTLHSYLPEAIQHFRQLVATITAKVEADRIVMALSDYDHPAWRKGIMPSYKANRKKLRRPVVFAPLRAYVHETYETFQRPGLEGDDVLGILLTHPSLIEGEKVCVSLDKDFKTLPGSHYDHMHDNHFTQTEDQADYYHMLQTLMGDSTDGYPGCPGIGKVKAAGIIDKYVDEDGGFRSRDAWEAIVKAYAKVGLSSEVALLNARVARICRATDYDFNNKKVILWNP